MCLRRNLQGNQKRHQHLIARVELTAGQRLISFPCQGLWPSSSLTHKMGVNHIFLTALLLGAKKRENKQGSWLTVGTQES